MLELLFFLVVLIFIALPFIVIATENSGKRADRQTYIVVLLIYVVSVIVVRFSVAAGAPLAIVTAEVPIGLALLVWLFRATVQRVRDMGRPKSLAYVAAIPLLGMLFLLYLTFPASVPQPSDR